MRALMREVIRQRADRVVQAHVELVDIAQVTPGFTRVRVRADALRAYVDPMPADAIKLHVPAVAGQEVPLPGYDDSGRLVWPAECRPRPLMRCFTVAEFHHEAAELSCDVVGHDGSAARRWLEGAHPGELIPLTGMRTEFVNPGIKARHVLIGDTSTLPAMASILRSLSHDDVVAAVLLADPGDAALLPSHSAASVQWVASADEVIRLVRGMGSLADAQVWVCAETRLVRLLRRILIDESEVDRDFLHACGYWTRGVDGEEAFDQSLVRFVSAAARGADVTDPRLLQELAFDQ